MDLSLIIHLVTVLLATPYPEVPSLNMLCRGDASHVTEDLSNTALSINVSDLLGVRSDSHRMESSQQHLAHTLCMRHPACQTLGQAIKEFHPNWREEAAEKESPPTC